ncbi:MAG: toxic anion resistance protein, partial [Clostridiales bacterium]
MSHDMNPSLTLDPGLAPEFAVAEPTPDQVAPVTPTLVEDNLSPEEQEQVRKFSAQIDLSNSNQILMYGAASQKHIADFSDQALASVRTKDLGEVGEMIGSLVVELKGFQGEEQKKGLAAFFSRGANKITALKARFDRAEVNVDQICGLLEGHQVQLLKDISMLDQMYERNLGYLKELTMYLLAGKQKLAQAKTEELPALLAKAEQSNLPEDAQGANDFAALIDRFEKKLHDLDLTRAIAIQMSP